MAAAAAFAVCLGGVPVRRLRPGGLPGISIRKQLNSAPTTATWAPLSGSWPWLGHQPQPHSTGSAMPQPSFDHPIGQVPQVRRKAQAHCLRGRHVEHQLEARQRFDRQRGRIGTIREPVDRPGALLPCAFAGARAVALQPARGGQSGKGHWRAPPSSPLVQTEQQLAIELVALLGRTPHQQAHPGWRSTLGQRRGQMCEPCACQQGRRRGLAAGGCSTAHGGTSVCSKRFRSSAKRRGCSQCSAWPTPA